MRYAEGKEENKIPISWEVAMAEKRHKGTKKFVPANKKYPGDEKLLSMLETMDTAEIAAEFGVTRHTVLNWIKRRGLKDAAKKIRFVERIEKANPAGIPVTASFGITTLRPGDTFDQLFSRADAALYEAKRAGRNQVISA